nr:uncharacterized protein LOC129449942 [Misgurnus anguillicaudatus]
MAKRIITWCEPVYRSKYGSLFVRIIVVSFRGVVRTRMAQNVEAEIQVVFNETSPQTIPSDTEVAEDLKAAAANATFQQNLPIYLNSITVTKQMQRIPVTFLTNGTYVPALLDSASNDFLIRSSMIKLWLEPFFITDYKASFSVLYLTNYSSYSKNTGLKVNIPTIKNGMDLTFPANTILPNDTQIVNTMLRAAYNETLPFKIFTYEIVVNGTAFSSGEASSRTSMLTASLLVVLSLLVTRFD